MRKLQLALNLSDNQTFKAAKILRNRSRKVIEPHLKETISESSHVLEEFFECVTYDFVSELKGKIKYTTQNMVICKDLTKFIAFILQSRNLTDDYHLKFGVDGGGKFLKICLSIQKKVSLF